MVSKAFLSASSFGEEKILMAGNLMRKFCKQEAQKNNDKNDNAKGKEASAEARKQNKGWKNPLLRHGDKGRKNKRKKTKSDKDSYFFIESASKKKQGENKTMFQYLGKTKTREESLSPTASPTSSFTEDDEDIYNANEPLISCTGKKVEKEKKKVKHSKKKSSRSNRNTRTNRKHHANRDSADRKKHSSPLLEDGDKVESATKNQSAQQSSKAKSKNVPQVDENKVKKKSNITEPQSAKNSSSSRRQRKKKVSYSVETVIDEEDCTKQESGGDVKKTNNSFNNSFYKDESKKLQNKISAMEVEMKALKRQLRRAADSTCDLVLAQTEMETQQGQTLFYKNQEFTALESELERVVEKASTAEACFMEEITSLTEELNAREVRHEKLMEEKDLEIAQLQEKVSKIQNGAGEGSKSSLEHEFLRMTAILHDMGC